MVLVENRKVFFSVYCESKRHFLPTPSFERQSLWRIYQMYQIKDRIMRTSSNSRYNAVCTSAQTVYILCTSPHLGISGGAHMHCRTWLRSRLDLRTPTFYSIVHIPVFSITVSGTELRFISYLGVLQWQHASSEYRPWWQLPLDKLLAATMSRLTPSFHIHGKQMTRSLLTKI